MARYSRTFRHIGVAKRAAYRERQRPQPGETTMAQPTTLTTVDDILTRLDAVAMQALKGARTHRLRGQARDADTLRELALQIRRLVISADKQINA
jgi:hypothetical protein